MRSAPGLQTIIIYAKLPRYSIALDRITGIRVIKYNRNKEPEFVRLRKAGIQGIDSASLFSLAGRYVK